MRYDPILAAAGLPARLRRQARHMDMDSAANNKDKNNMKAGMIENLCRHGANVECAKGKHEQTPLMIALSTAHSKAVEVLLCHCAELGKCNAEGTSCWDMAWHKEMQLFFESLGIGKGRGVTGTDKLLILTL